MKHVIFFALLLLSTASFAQQKDKTRCMPAHGFWVVESNVQSPKESVIFFYNKEGQCISREVVSGRRVNVKRKRVVRHLNDVLNQSLLAWKENATVKENAFFLAKRL